MRKLVISGKWIRVKPKPGDLFMNIFGGRKVARIRDKELAEEMVNAYNSRKHEEVNR